MGKILHENCQKIHGKTERDIAYAVGDKNPGNDTARYQQAEHCTKVVFQGSEGKLGRLGAGGVPHCDACHANTNYGGDDIQAACDQQHELEAISIGQETTRDRSRHSDDSEERLRDAKRFRAVFFTGILGNKRIETWADERAGDRAESGRQQQPLPGGGKDQGYVGEDTHNTADGDGPQSSQRIGDVAAENLEPKWNDRR